MTARRRDEDLLAQDEATRRLAQERFTGALLVEAGAGTGKTSILVSRIVVWSMGEGWERALARAAAEEPGAPASSAPADVAADVLGRVAAITFTEAAAAEMAQRTGALLAQIAEEAVPESVLVDRLPPPGAERVGRARALVAALDRLQVRTIHAFCLGLLAQHPLDAGVHPGFSVDADERVRAEVVREIVEAAVVVGYASPGDPDWLALAEEGFGPTEVEAALIAVVGGRAPVDVFADDPFTPERVGALRAELASALDDLLAAAGDRLAEASRAKLGQALLEAGAVSRGAVDRASDATPEALQALVDELAEIWADNLRRHLAKWAKDGFSNTERDAFGDRAPAVCRAAGELASLIDAVRGLAPMRLVHARRVLEPLSKQAREELRRRGAAVFDSLLRDARDLLRNHPEVADRVRGDLDQLLVDEFQDTDPLQCDIVHVLALEGPEASRPGLFLVGDPKQSIYGWRNADLGAYDAFVAALPDDGGSGRLTRNFRSLPEILAQVEDAIAPVMQREVGLQPEFQPLVAVRAEKEGAPGVVEHWVSWDWDASERRPAKRNAARAAELEAEAIAQDIRRRTDAGEVSLEKVGILFRAQSDVEIYLRALRAAGIPYAVERDRSYYRRREIIEASALVRCVLDRNDVVALLAWMRSASVGVPDAALLPLWQRRFPQSVAELEGPRRESLDALDALIADAANAVAPDIPGIDRVKGWEASAMHALRVLAVLRESFDADAPDHFVEKLRRLSLLEVTESARYQGDYRTANLDLFFRDLVDELESDCDRETLLRRLRTGVSESAEVEQARPQGALAAVRVMTIHKAKGLDFEHTYVVQLHKGSGRGGWARSPEFEAGTHAGRVEYTLLGAATPGYHHVARHADRVGDAERIRTLYVAMTRARDRLVLVGSWPPDGGVDSVAEAATHIDLLGLRASGVPDLAERMRACAEDGGPAAFEVNGASWRFPALVPEHAADAAAAPDAPQLATADAIRAESRTLEERRRDAAERSARRWSAAPSTEPEPRVPDPPAAAPSNAADDPGARAARLAGTLVHRILEELDLRSEPTADLGEHRARLPDLVRALAPEPVPSEVAVATVARANEVLDALAAGTLLARLVALGAGEVLRELPVLLAPEPEGGGPVGFTAGVIDLCYRDPETGDWVIADFKTDRVESDADLANRVARYTEQGRVYVRALREALELDRDPRFELWFLRADRIETVA